MRYCGIQPQYFPRLHYFARLLDSDLFVIRDDCQFVSRHKYPDGTKKPSFQVHTPIKFTGGTFHLNVPYIHQGYTPLFKTLISYDHNWVHAHLKTISNVYTKAANFKKIFPEIIELLNQKLANLTDLNIKILVWGINHLLDESFDITKLTIDNLNQKLTKQNQFRLQKIARSSETGIIYDNLTANQKILALIKHFGANEDHCGGTGVVAYLENELFEAENIKVTVQDWKCNIYPQTFPKTPFIPNLSIIDLLMNVDNKQAISIIKG